MNFQAKRVTHEYKQANCAPPQEVFPLLCPLREMDWVPEWQYRMIYSSSGVAELGCIFATPNDDGSENIWVVTEYDPTAFNIAFVWVNAGMVAAQLSIRLLAKSAQETAAYIRYTYTGLSEQGNRAVERNDQAWFQQKMDSWETAINHYLRTGSKIHTHAWE